MADKKITELTALTAPDSADVLAIVDVSPSGETKKSTVAQLNAVLAHQTLSGAGTNTHAQIDTFITSKAQASGIASLDGSSKVVQDPANATATPTASKIPIADGSGKLDGWITAELTASQKDALAGTSGTPSSTNKYVTNDDTAENTASKLVRRKSDSNITVPTTPTATTDAASKSYVDSNGSVFYGHTTEKSVSVVNAAQDYTITTISMPALGANESLMIYAQFECNNGSGSATFKINIDGNTIYSNGVGSPYLAFAEAIVVNRNSTSSQYYWSSAGGTAGGTFTGTLGSAFNITLVAQSTQASRTAKSQYCIIKRSNLTS